MTAIRRLLIVMLVLLGISTLAAALVPPDGQPGGDTSATKTTPAQEQAVAGAGRVPNGRALSVSIEVGGPKTPVVPVAVGDQLSLTVGVSKADQVEIRAFGLLAAAAPEAPARFDLLAEQEGEYAIRLVEADRVVARITVGPREKAKQAQSAVPGGTSHHV